ncbi:MAG: hypothetical protein U5N86_12580 [Planctomycetota bacterium]|nr:hypothetical protein [Planctomycetota bacterium]
MPEASRPVTEFNSVTTARAAGKLKDVSFSVASGELVGVLATPPEALREFALLAAGLTSPLSGTVIALGKKAVQLDKNDRCRIGYLPKGSGLLRRRGSENRW